MELPYDPAIPLLGIYPEKTIIQKDTCSTVFTAALLITARPCKQPKCSLMDGWIKMWNISYNGILLSHKKNSIFRDVDGPRDYHTEWSESDKGKHHMIVFIYGI